MKITKTVTKKSCEWWTKKIKIYNKKHKDKKIDKEIQEIQSKFTEKYTEHLLSVDYEGSYYFDLNSEFMIDAFNYAGIENPSEFFNNDPLKMKIQNNSVYVSTNNESYTKIY